MLRAFVEEIQDWWDLLIPPVATPEEKIADALAIAQDSKNDLMIERWKTQANLRRADAAVKKACSTRDPEEIRYAVKQKVSALQTRADLDYREEDLRAREQNLRRMADNSAMTKATLDVIAAVNQKTPDPVYATQTLTRFQLTSMQEDTINAMVNDALEQRREEQDDARAEKQGETDSEVERLTQRYLQQVNQQLLSELPMVNSRVIPPSVMEGTKGQLKTRNKEGLQRTDKFLAQGGVL